MDVPYRVLTRKYSFDSDGVHEEDNKSENMIIHGDNLVALKSLLLTHEGKVDCIYIDPPYNTGNEGWVYNDNINDPKLQKWLGEVVGKEGEDLSRHDKWLCMMYPRLKLMQKLLSDEGVIFISIDDNELYNLKLICDEIFGCNCFIADISWQMTYSKRNDSKGIAPEVEHILVYSKSPNWQPNKLERTEEMDSNYSSPDGDERIWSSVTLNAAGAATHTGMVYAIQYPITGDFLYHPNGRCWSLEQPQLLELMNEWSEYELKDIDYYEKRLEICNGVEKTPEMISAIVLTNPTAENFEKANERYLKGANGTKPWPIVYFTAGGKGGMRRKQYLDKSSGRVPSNFWPHSEVGHTGEAKNELAAVFSGKVPFDTPKPIRFVEQIIKISTKNNSIVLDAFAGYYVIIMTVVKSLIKSRVLVLLQNIKTLKMNNLCVV